MRWAMVTHGSSGSVTHSTPRMRQSHDESAGSCHVSTPRTPWSWHLLQVHRGDAAEGERSKQAVRAHHEYCRSLV